MRIYLDFDGTVVEHHYPAIGAENPGALRIISLLQAKGHHITLNTYRADIDLESVHSALNFINASEFISNPITQFMPRKLDPKPFDIQAAIACNQLYIDDVSEGTPMRRNIVLEYGMMVNWEELEKVFLTYGVM
jgi:hypothetical protein